MLRYSKAITIISISMVIIKQFETFIEFGCFVIKN